MEDSKLKKVNEKIEDTVVGTYKKIESTVLGGYKKIEDAAVGGYTRIEDAFVDKYLKKDGESVKEAKERLKKETGNSVK